MTKFTLYLRSVWTILVVVAAFMLPSSDGYDPVNPQDNRSPYTANDVLRSSGSAFPFSNDFPSGRVLHTLDSNDDYLFVYGGYSSNGTILGDMNLFHIPSERWSGPIVRRECCNDLGQEIDTIGAEIDTKNITFLKVGFQGDYPLPRADHASCVVNGVLYIHGGETERNNIGLMQDLQTFDPLLLRWRTIDHAVSLTGGIPSRRAGHIMVADPTQSRCILFGGRQTSRASGGSVIGLSDVWELDTSAFRWRKLDLPNANTFTARQVSPIGRHHAAAALTESRFFYIYGGSDPSSGLLYNDIWLFDLNIAAWKQLYPVLTGNAPLPSYVFAPPPMEHAHMLPITVASDNNSSDQHVSLETSYEGFLIYGGVGTGGGCIAAECNNRQIMFGQIYFYSFQQQTWMRPFFDIHRDQPTKETTSHWLFARLHDHLNQKRIKEYAYEKISVSNRRKLFYEFGGLQANANAVRRNNQQAPIVGISDEGGAIAPPKNAPLQAVGGPIPATFSDTLTGEFLNDAVLAPTNAYWDISSAFYDGSIFNDNLNRSIVFHRNLRLFTIAPRDLVMIESYGP